MAIKRTRSCPPTRRKKIKRAVWVLYNLLPFIYALPAALSARGLAQVFCLLVTSIIILYAPRTLDFHYVYFIVPPSAFGVCRIRQGVIYKNSRFAKYSTSVIFFYFPILPVSYSNLLCASSLYPHRSTPSDLFFGLTAAVRDGTAGLKPAFPISHPGFNDPEYLQRWLSRSSRLSWLRYWYEQ